MPDLEADRCFTIEEFDGPNDEGDQTYLAEFLQVGPNGAGVALWFSSAEMEKKRFRQRITAQDRSELTDILAAGFEVDSHNWIRYPIRLEVEEVAQGAVDDDYTDALKPLHEALDAALKNVDRFAALNQL